MSTLFRLARNTVALAISRGLQPVISLVLVLTVARFMGAGGFGQYSFVFSFLVIFQIIAPFGLKTLIAREVAKDKKNANTFFINGCVIAIPLSIIALLAMSVTIPFFHHESKVILAVRILSFSLIASTILDCFEGVFPNTMPDKDEITREIKLFAAKGEYEPATLVIHALKDLKRVKVEVSDLFNKNGKKFNSFG